MSAPNAPKSGENAGELRMRVVELSLVEGERRSGPPEMAWADTPHGTFFVLVELSAPADMWDDVSSLLVDVAVEAVTLAKGSVTAALQEAAERVNRALLIENERLPPEDQVWAGLNMVCQQGETLFMAQAGPALTYIARGTRVTRFPKTKEELQADEHPSAAPLGDDRRVHVRLARFTLRRGDIVVLSASHLPSLASEEAIRRVLTQADAGDVAEALAQLAKGQDYSALVMQAEPVTSARQVVPVVPEPTTPAPPPPKVSAPPPMSRPPSPSAKPKREQARAAMPPADEEAVVLRPIPGRGRRAPRGRHRVERPPGELDGRKIFRPLLRARLGRAGQRAAGAAGLIGRFARRLAAWGLLALALLLRVLELALETYERSLVPLWRRLMPWLDAVAIEGAMLARAVGRRGVAIARHLLPGTQPTEQTPRRGEERPSPSPEGRTFYPFMALVLPLLLVVLAAFTYWRVTRVDLARFNELIAGAQAEIAQAEQADRESAGVLLLSVQEKLEQAEAINPGAPEVAALRQRFQRLEEQVARVQRVEATRVAPLSSEADPADLVYADGTLYVLDLKRGAVFQVAADAQEDQPLDERTPLAAPGLPVSGRILFITWMPPGGTRAHEALVGLAEGGAFEFVPGAPQPLRRLNFAPVAGEIMDVGHYNGNLYLLDRTEKQIWKYIPDMTGGYGDPPVPWMKSDAQATLRVPIRMAIDGDIYVLEADGRVVKMTVGQLRPFQLEAVVPPLEAPVAIFTDEKAPDVPLRYLYVAEAGRVLVFDKEGKLVVQFWPPSGAAWGEIRDVAADDAESTIYLLTTTGVWRLPLTAQPPGDLSPGGGP